MRFSSAVLPERDRAAMWREVFGRQLLRLDIELLPGVLFHGDLTVYPLNGVGIVSASICGTCERRTRELITDGNDAIGLAVNLSGPLISSHCGYEVTLGEGDAVLASCAEPATFIRASAGRSIGLVVPRATLAPLVPNFEDTFGRPIPRGSDALKLLASYIAAVVSNEATATPELRLLAATHIHDLVALTIGATRDAVAVAEGRGASAARLGAIKADIIINLGRGDLSIGMMSTRHRLGPRYIQRLFEHEGTSFTEFVLDRRLARAHRLLTDQRLADRPISMIAFEVGFGDLSYFNRTFRRRYGATPTDVREQARLDAEP
jgi:AraC-like DNA-binding protein